MALLRAEKDEYAIEFSRGLEMFEESAETAVGERECGLECAIGERAVGD